MVWYETVLFDALSFLRFIGISDSVTKFGLITYNCLCNKKSILHIKAQYCLTVGGCRISHVSVLACICVCACVCVCVWCVQGMAANLVSAIYSNDRTLLLRSSELYLS